MLLPVGAPRAHEVTDTGVVAREGARYNIAVHDDVAKGAGGKAQGL